MSTPAQIAAAQRVLRALASAMFERKEETGGDGRLLPHEIVSICVSIDEGLSLEDAITVEMHS